MIATWAVPATGSLISGEDLAHTVRDLFDAEGLGDEVAGPDFLSGLPGLLVELRGEEDERDVPGFYPVLDRLAQFGEGIRTVIVP